MKTKYLDAKGKGIVDYDFEEDTLFFKVKNRDYLKSIDFGDFVLDVDTKGFVTGIQIFDASKLFDVSKTTLNKVKRWQFHTKVEENKILLQLSFEAVNKNKTVVERHSLVRDYPSSFESVAEVVCNVD